MRLGINACNYNDRPAGGTHKFVGIYTKLFESFPENEYIVYEPRDARIRNFFKPLPQVSFVETPLSSASTLQRHLGGLPYWASALKKYGVELFETAYFPAVIHRKGKTLLTIHDLRYAQFPEFYSRARRVFGNYIIQSGIEKADVLITISYAMKKEIEEFYAPRVPIEVLTPALPLSFHAQQMDPDKLENLKNRFSLHRPFLLTVGHLEKRKNFLNLIKAFELTSKRFDGDLLIVGNPTDDTDRLKDYVRARNLMPRVRFLSGISDQDLAMFYQLCSAFVFPSLYEGFGIPLLEAMYFERPYILSHIDVFKELTGSRGEYFDPHSPDDMAEKILMVLASDAKQEALRRLARERLNVYNYASIAQSYQKLLKRMV